MTKEIKNIILEWMSLADNDLLASKDLSKSSNFLLSAFHLQQCLEKYLKAYYMVKKKEQPPYVHNLIKIAELADLLDKLDDTYINLLDDLNPYYIKARYPTYKEKVAKKLSKELVKNLLKETEVFIKWLKTKMK